MTKVAPPTSGPSVILLLLFLYVQVPVEQRTASQETVKPAGLFFTGILVGNDFTHSRQGDLVVGVGFVVRVWFQTNDRYSTTFRAVRPE